MDRQTEKPWWHSLTIWSMVAAGVVGAMTAILGPENLWVAAAVAVFTALGIHGRLRAKKKLVS